MNVMEKEINAIQKNQVSVLKKFIKTDVFQLISSALIYLTNMGEMADDVLSDYSEVHRAIFAKAMEQKETTENIVKNVSSILEFMNFDSEQIISKLKTIMSQEDFTAIDKEVEKLQESNPLLAFVIDNNRLVFEDFMYFDIRDLFKLARRTNQNTWVKALNLAPENMIDRYCATLSDKQAVMFKEDIEFSGYIPLSEIQESQNEITQTMKDMYENGIICFKF